MLTVRNGKVGPARSAATRLVNLSGRRRLGLKFRAVRLQSVLSLDFGREIPVLVMISTAKKFHDF
jgi:hypothetical protein